MGTAGIIAKTIGIPAGTVGITVRITAKTTGIPAGIITAIEA